MTDPTTPNTHYVVHVNISEVTPKHTLAAKHTSMASVVVDRRVEESMSITVKEGNQEDAVDTALALLDVRRNMLLEAREMAEQADKGMVEPPKRGIKDRPQA